MIKPRRHGKRSEIQERHKVQGTGSKELVHAVSILNSPFTSQAGFAQAIQTNHLTELSIDYFRLNLSNFSEVEFD
jgi:hypothetical protein